ncbi:MAG TPA: tandem-95 repeat protein, partial [Ramlibacter sp.]|nr:tandem-95 repeat protein [Ramlibacter sp.]
APVGAAVVVAGAEDAASIAITLGGSDVDGSIASFALQNLPANGQLYVDAGLTTLATVGTSYAAGTFWFVPDADYNGSTSFAYRVTDNLGVIATADATVRIDVSAVNDLPTVSAVTVVGLEDATSIAITLAGGDLDGTVAGFVLQGLPANGLLYTDAARTTLAVAGTTYASGNLWFVPGANFNGGTSFGYRALDDLGGTSLTAAVTINVSAVNDAPTVNNVTASGAEDAASIAITLAGGDIDGAVTGFTLQNLPANGLLYTDAGLTTLAVAGTTYPSGSFWFVPAADFNGTASFAYTATDDAGANSGTAAAVVMVAAVNDAPVAAAVTATGQEDAPAMVVTLGASDIDSAVAGFVLDSLPSDGVLYTDATLTTRAVAGALGAGTYWFVPAADFSGTVGFSYRGIDAQGAASALAVVTLQVTPVNDAPVRTGSPAAIVAPEASAGVSLGLENVRYGVGGGTDEAGQVLTVTMTALPDVGTGRIVLADGSAVVPGTRYTAAQLAGMRFLPASGVSSGSATLEFTVADDGGRAAGGSDELSQRLSISVVNRAPLLDGARLSFNVMEDAVEDAGVSVTQLLAGHATDPGGVIGLAVTGAASEHGAWQFSRDGGRTWQSLQGAGEQDATLLRADARIRFVPVADWNGTAGGLSVRAWDGTGGTDVLLRGDARMHGGSGPFSAVAAAVDAVVLPVNDAPRPQAMGAPPADVPGDGAPVPLGLAQVSYGAGGGADESTQTLTVVITTVPDSSVGVVLLADGTVVVPGGSYTVGQLQGMQFRATGQGGGQQVQLAWMVRDDGGVAGGGSDRTAASLQFTVAQAPGAAPAPVPAAVATPAAAPVAAPAPVAAAAAAAPAVAPAPARAPDAGGGLDDALGGAGAGVGAGFVLTSAALPDRIGAGVESARVATAVLPDRVSVQLASLQPPTGGEFTVMGFAGQGVAGMRMNMEQLQVALRSGEFIDELNRLRDHLRQEFNLDKTVSVSVAGLSLGVSVLYVLWLIRGGVLLGSYLSALPAWRILDPLPVLARAGEEEDEDEDPLDPAADRAGDPLRGMS